MTTIRELIIEFFEAHPSEDWAHGPVVDFVEERYLAMHGRKPRDPWRVIRTLHQKGMLVKVKDGIYRYDPAAVTHRELADFTSAQKAEILERDGYKCVICGRGAKEGVNLHVDHIKPRNLGGQAVLENGQTLCAQHNFIKKQSGQTETAKKMFIRLHELSVEEGNSELEAFCAEILQLYGKHGINDHIQWTSTRKGSH